MNFMTIRSPLERPTLPASPDRFAGAVFVEELVVPKETSALHAGIVTFGPAGRTAWHSHAVRQILIVTAGAGIVHAEGEPPRRIEAGCVVDIPPGVVHWHGAMSDTSLAHIAIVETDGSPTRVHKQIDDAEYDRIQSDMRDLSRRSDLMQR